MKKILFLLLSLSSLHVYSQHFFSAGYSAARATTGDMWASSIENQYGYYFSGQFFGGLGFDFTYGSAGGYFVQEENGTVITQANTSPFFNKLNEKLTDEGWIVNPAKTTKSIYRSLYLIVGYDFLKSQKHQLSFSAGPVISLHDKTYQSERIEGYFTSPISDSLEINLIIPLHVNYYDYGFILKLDYSYQLTDVLGIGTQLLP